MTHGDSKLRRRIADLLREAQSDLDDSGVLAMDISPDGKHLVTLSADPGPQILSVWDCTRDGSADMPLFSAQVTTATAAEAEPTTSKS